MQAINRKNNETKDRSNNNHDAISWEFNNDSDIMSDFKDK